LNDLNILDLSPLLESFLDGTLDEKERTCDAIPFTLGGVKFSQMFALVDGIYPEFSRFVKTIAEPVGPTAKKFAG